MDILPHEIEGNRLDFIGKFVPHVLPALLAHVFRRDFEESIPGAACPGDGKHVVARHQGEILSFEEKERRLAPPEGLDVGLAIDTLGSRDGDYVESVHGEPEISRSFEAEEDILVFREGEARFLFAGELGWIIGESSEIFHPFVPAAGEGEGERKFRWCNHRVSAPRLSFPAGCGIP